MAKYYVQSGSIRLVLDAESREDAAVRAFQWSCDKQATIQARTPLEHIQVAERLGWQLEETIEVSERGFDQPDAWSMDTLETMPTFMPFSLAISAMVFTGRLSGAMPIMPMLVFWPVARAVAEAAEPVMKRSAA